MNVSNDIKFIVCPTVSDQEIRWSFLERDKTIASVACIILDKNSCFYAIKAYFLTLFNWKYVKIEDDNSESSEELIVNINSVVKHFGLTADEVRTKAKSGTLQADCCEILRKRIINEEINLIKKTEIKSEEFIKSVSLLRNFPLESNTIYSNICFYFAPIKGVRSWNFLPHLKAVKADYFHRSELTSTYYFSNIKIYKETDRFFINLDHCDIEYIKGRDWTNSKHKQGAAEKTISSLSTYTGAKTNAEIQEIKNKCLEMLTSNIL